MADYYLTAGTPVNRLVKRTGRPPGSKVPEIPIGTRFAYWEIIGERTGRGGREPYRYPCRCDCGREYSVLGYTLTNGSSTQCRVCGVNRLDEDLTGKIFGRWMVMRRLAIEERSGKDISWLCRCECGEEKALEIQNLRRGGGCRACFQKRGSPHRIRPYEAVFNTIRHSAFSRKIKFTVSYKEFVEQVQTGRCHYCHLPLIWAKYRNLRTKVGKQPHHMDRKDNAIGYEPGNIVASCLRCNYAKRHDWTYEEWFKMTECFRTGELKLPDSDFNQYFNKQP